MLQLIARRLLTSIPLLAATAIFVFLLFQIVGVDPAATILGENATQEAKEALREKLGLDEPVLIQLVNWFANAFQGDLGASYYTGLPVAETIATRLPVTMSVAIGGMVIAVLLGLPMGVLAATYRNTIVDRGLTVVATVLVAVPGFWLALVLVLVFALHWRIFPVVGYTPFATNPWGWVVSLTLPWLAVGLHAMGVILRQTRSAMLEALDSGYIRALTMRGVAPSRRISVYALKNAMLPVATVIGLQTSIAIGGSLVVEVVFAMPGTGMLLGDAVIRGDLPVLQGTVVMIAVLVVLINLAMDVAYGLLDPKVRVQ